MWNSFYLAPEGRPIPADMRSNDKWFQHIAIVVSDMDKAYQRLRVADNYEFVSSAAAIPLPEANLGFKKGLRVRDPDEHVMQLIEK